MQRKSLLKHKCETLFALLSDCVITTSDITRNWSFLKCQLEPRRFLDMLRDIDGIDNAREKILSSLPKQTRCIAFLSVLKNNKTALEKFGPELKRLHLTKIIDFLYDARTQGSDGLYIINEKKTLCLF